MRRIVRQFRPLQPHQHMGALVFDIADHHTLRVRGGGGVGDDERGVVGAHADAALRRVQHVVAAHEAGDEFAGRPVVDVQRRAHLLDAAVVHHHHGVGQRHGLFLRVRHVHEGQAQLLLPAAQFGAHLHAQERVQRRQGFVQQQGARLGDQGARQCHPLLLAAAELAGLALRQVAHGHAVEQVLRARLPLGLGHALHLQAEGHVVSRAEVRKQRKALKHHRRAARRGRQRRDVMPAQQHRAIADGFVAGDHAQRRALAAARRPQQAAVAAGGDLQRNALHRGRPGTVALGQRNQLDGSAPGAVGITHGKGVGKS